MLSALSIYLFVYAEHLQRSHEICRQGETQKHVLRHHHWFKPVRCEALVLSSKEIEPGTTCIQCSPPTQESTT